jgi:hypothetical protein
MSAQSEPTISLTSGGGSVSGGSPKIIYTIFLIGLCKSHFEAMGSGSISIVNFKTAALIAYCPNRDKRDELWRTYSEESKMSGDPEQDMSKMVTASVHAVGELMSYLNTVLEFETVSTAMIL